MIAELTRARGALARQTIHMIHSLVAFGFILAASVAAYMAGRAHGRYDALHGRRRKPSIAVRELVTVCELVVDQGTAPRSRC